MLARALTTVTRAQQQQQQHQPNRPGSLLASGFPSSSSVRTANRGFDDHLAATDELKNYNQEEDEEDNPDEEGEEAGALRQEDDEDNEAAPVAIQGELLSNRLRPRQCSASQVGVSGIDQFFVINAGARNLRQDKSELVAEGESAAAAAAAALWRPFDAVMPPPHRQAVPLLCGPPISPPQSQQLQDSSSQSSHRHTAARRSPQQQQPKQRIKKPLNAFMLYMRDNRAAVAAEHSLRESAEINRLLGRQWQSLSRQEQAKYYHLAQLEKERHCRLHPNWSAKDNYGSCVGSGSGSGASGSVTSADHSHRRQPQQRQQRQPIAATMFDLDGSSNKKCRAIYGLERQDLWCRPCRRKKRCSRFGDNKPGVGVAMETLPLAPVINE